MTSDTRPKQIAVELKLAGKTVRIGGMCKGAGMIHPGMSPTGKRPASLPLHATMLAFITTDAAILGRLHGEQLLPLAAVGDAVAEKNNIVYLHRKLGKKTDLAGKIAPQERAKNGL